ncbi:NERD domain-containing protein [Aquabacterium sp. G14]|uniref:nuclease-related domain-containing DEAD/DEAH box helicase n=1 Tax=Aquabacterium sp. G14 TaxID=3130164 RepID=UPI00309AC59B
MATFYPDLQNIDRLTVPPTAGERHLLTVLADTLDDSYEVYFNPYLDGDRPDVIVIKPECGVLIIEVKDWNLDHYRVDINGRWHYQNNILRSPQQQVFRYKKNLFDLHLPVLGLQQLKNHNFFNLITVGVYFHAASREQINRLYSEALYNVQGRISDLNRNYQCIAREIYEEKMDRCERLRYKISRDIGISWGFDNVVKKIQSFRKMRENILFTQDIHEDFQRRLKPPVHVVQQGVAVAFDAKQFTLTESSPLFAKIKGVAGCGKTTILAQRAINAHKRHGGQVLILTFNITLRHYIRDAISRLQGGGDQKYCEIIHYHAFIHNQLNNLGIDLEAKVADLPPTKRTDHDYILGLKSLFEDVETERFPTILIDEVQDFHPAWVKLVRDCFLSDEGEMVLFGDQSQNIYGRPNEGRESSIVQGFGSWIRLTKSYRTFGDAPLVELFRDFQLQYLISKYEDSEVFAEAEGQSMQISMRHDLLCYETYGDSFDADRVFNSIQRYIVENKLHPNDVALISSSVEFLIVLNERLILTEKTKVTFEEDAEVRALPPRARSNSESLQNELEKIRRRKKSFFTQNSGLIKLSTIHSFKGLESQTVFCILAPGDDPEMVYTAITRAQRHLVIFDISSSRYRSFFDSHMDVVDALPLAH